MRGGKICRIIFKTILRALKYKRAVLEFRENYVRETEL